MRCPGSALHSSLNSELKIQVKFKMVQSGVKMIKGSRRKKKSAWHRFHGKNQHQVLREPKQDIQTAPITYIPFYPDTFHEKLRSRSLALMEAAGLVTQPQAPALTWEDRKEIEQRDSEEKKHTRSSLMCLITLKQPLCRNALTLSPSLSNFYIKLLSDRKAQKTSAGGFAFRPVWRHWLFWATIGPGGVRVTSHTLWCQCWKD